MSDLIDRTEAIKRLKMYGAEHNAIAVINGCPSADTDLSEYSDKLQWIPCSEKLPDTGEDVFLCCAVKGIYGELRRYICKGYHVNRYEMESNANWDQGCDEYRNEDDKFYVLEGWYERIHNWGDYASVAIEDFVLAWMPLPEPYKEKQDDE